MKNAMVNVLKRERISCYAHLLNLMIERVFKRFQELAGNENDDLDSDDSEIDESETDLKKLSVQILKMIKKCKKIVGLFNHSPELKENLYKNQKSKNLPNKMLINSVSTRWNSEYLMIERILEQVDNVNEVLFATRKHCHLVLKLSEKKSLN
ncbi:zinc finger BED domain-containing 1-like [Brachionus plicatilis]|uniref:Zinc finger BED domain-containing 1-like n=1 Tax=Brachionus plicatilis TaxID=10195 RepID=A0A3M7SJ15_BRAPC|nr:zinc finger BED domain-containing 1-like [Brachionus plicatilis]